jgi:hypothetical protein
MVLMFVVVQAGNATAKRPNNMNMEKCPEIGFNLGRHSSLLVQRQKLVLNTDAEVASDKPLVYKDNLVHDRVLLKTEHKSSREGIPIILSIS